MQDAANATLRSETLRRNCVRCNNRKRWRKKPSKKVQNVCDGGAIKHGSDFSCVCDAGHTVQFNKLFAMRRNKRNGQPDEGVCDIQHTVHSDELFVIRQHKRNGQPDQRCVRYTTCGSLGWIVCVETWEQKWFKWTRCVWYEANRSVIENVCEDR